MKFYSKTIWIIILSLAFISCGPKPSVYLEEKNNSKPNKTLAILPFDNYSGKEDAGKQVANAFLVELLKMPSFHVVEPGEVDRVMREERIRSSNQIDLNAAKLFKEKLLAEYVLIGAVNEFDYLKDGDRDVPSVGFAVRLLDTSNGQIVWAANYSRRGDDHELIFGWGLVNSLTELTQTSVRDAVSRIKIAQ
jgi:TolB-like protein